MHLCYIIIIMVCCGIVGGLVNYHSDANRNKENGAILRGRWVCIFFGLAATLMVPFFLKLADSNLLNNIYIKGDCCGKDSVASKKQVSVYYITHEKDSIGTIVQSDTIKQENKPTDEGAKIDEPESAPCESAKGYLLWMAYCIIAAAAGTRFIDMLLDKVITKQQYDALAKKHVEQQAENEELEQKKQELEHEKEKHDRRIKEQLPVSEQQQIATARQTNADEVRGLTPAFVFNVKDLPPIIHADDPQKDRFGGKAEQNNRKLSVRYSKGSIPMFLNLEIVVESANGENLDGDVYMFLHDSFAKSVIVLDGTGKTAVQYEIPAYGAFTVGVVCDNGDTRLEYDIAGDSSFPETFRNR